MRAIDDGAYANLDLPRRLRRAGLSGRDAAFATELVYGATRMRGLYDPIIAACADRPVQEIDPAVRDVLRLGCHQLLAMRVPPYGAVSQQVALTRQQVGTGASGFVNAVLRRVSEHDLQTWQAQVAPRTGRVAELAVRFSHPPWIVRAFRAALLENGVATDDDVDRVLRELLEANNEPAKVTLVARPGLCDAAEIEAAGGRSSGLSPYGFHLEGGDPGALPAVREGRAAAQDEASQLVVLALLAAELQGHPAGPEQSPATPEEPSASTEEPLATQEQWLDMCAGPGGKAGLLAALAAQQGAVLFANDVSEHRADLVRRTVAAAVDAGAQVMVGVGDGRTIGEQEPGAFDRVLLDAPCSGLGSLRRRPEARWRRRAQDVPELGELQRELLISAIESTRPGGVIGYATCTPHLPETRYLLADVLAQRSDVTPIDVQLLIQEVTGAPVSDLGHGPYAQWWPHRHGTDAMFLALLRKHLPGPGQLEPQQAEQPESLPPEPAQPEPQQPEQPRSPQPAPHGEADHQQLASPDGEPDQAAQ